MSGHVRVYSLMHDSMFDKVLNGTGRCQDAPIIITNTIEIPET